jgi:hypothetical protein
MRWHDVDASTVVVPMIELQEKKQGRGVAAEREKKEGICVINLCNDGGDDILRVVPYGSRRVREDDPNCLTSCGALDLSCAGLRNGSNYYAGAGSTVEATSAINFQLPPLAPKQIAIKKIILKSRNLEYRFHPSSVLRSPATAPLEEKASRFTSRHRPSRRCPSTRRPTGC